MSLWLNACSCTLDFTVGNVFGRNGKSDLLRRLPNYNQAARSRFTPWFVLRDLDNDAICASQAIQKWLPQPSEGMRLRVAVHAIEAWMMADAVHLCCLSERFIIKDAN